ncbi:S-locus glycoprotein [Abeliophyllum distichum]|uniref:S-locus glycoprotein n=1 Tax=Abeliophyllum distichum TaxID=126358 RepID=A0ABD1PSK1_9LAMI
MGPAVTPSVTVHGEADLYEMRPMVSLEKKIEEMMAQKTDDAFSKRKDRRRQMVLEEDPFAPEIMAISRPKGFKQPMIEAYDGVTDPLDHLRTFVHLIRLYTAPDVIMCRSFPLTLRREARDWVATLAPRSIKTFDDFLEAL